MAKAGAADDNAKQRTRGAHIAQPKGKASAVALQETPRIKANQGKLLGQQAFLGKVSIRCKHGA